MGEHTMERGAEAHRTAEPPAGSRGGQRHMVREDVAGGEMR